MILQILDLLRQFVPVPHHARVCVDDIVALCVLVGRVQRRRARAGLLFNIMHVDQVPKRGGVALGRDAAKRILDRRVLIRARRAHEQDVNVLGHGQQSAAAEAAVGSSVRFGKRFIHQGPHIGGPKNEQPVDIYQIGAGQCAALS